MRKHAVKFIAALCLNGIDSRSALPDGRIDSDCLEETGAGLSAVTRSGRLAVCHRHISWGSQQHSSHKPGAGEEEAH